MREPTRAAAEAFVQYLFTPEAQAEFAENGFRWCPRPSHEHLHACTPLALCEEAPYSSKELGVSSMQ